MTSKKAGTGKKTVKSRKKQTAGKKPRPAEGSPVLRSIAGLGLLIGVVVLTFVLVHHFFPPEQTTRNDRTSNPYEIYPEEDYDYSGHGEEGPPKRSRLPKIAIIIDDIGYSRPIAAQLAELDKNITFSVLPNAPHCRSIAKEAHKKGLEIMMHLPMEPNEYPRINPGPGALLVSMAPDELTGLLKSHIAAIPWVKGVNNHMGSRMTSHSSKMYQIFVVLKKEGLFFVDSRTSSQSLCRPSARLLQIPFAERDVFLDHRQTRKAIRRQIRLLVTVAEKKGSAVGIGHPHKVTVDALREELGFIKSSVEIVHASKLVKPLGHESG